MYTKYIKIKFISICILLILLCNLVPAVESIKFSFFSFENNAPYEPNNPYPANGSINIPINTTLNWTGGDPDGDPVSYDIYFGTNNSPPLVVSNQSSTYYYPGILQNQTSYYWKIIAWDNQSASTEGPIWTFTTEQLNQPPYEPNNPYPANESTNIPINTTLNWTGGDPDGDPVTYDVYLGTTTTPPIVSTNQTQNYYQPSTLNFNTTYYWTITAWDNHSTSTTGPLWSFTTEINNPPYEPSNPKPDNGTINIDINSNIKWDGGDPDGDPVTYDVYFGKTYPPQQVASNYTNTTYDLFIMEYNTTYYWKIVAWDSSDVSTEGPEWFFTTSGNSNRPPNRPVIDGVLGLLVPNRPYDYNFTSTDPDNDDVFYYIDWGDGTYEDWIGPYFSDDIIKISHTWPPATKIYQIKVKAKDIYGSESDWGSFLVFVLSPRNSDSSLFSRIILRFPILQRIIMIMQLINYKMIRI
jgi:hypothetical protein